jgi:serine/threonine protein kinase
MSPEQATGDRFVGPATDTYALGCVLFEMLVGEPPFPGSTAQAVLGKIIAGKPVSTTEHRPSVPPHVDAAVPCALEKLPADRFPSAQAFGKTLADRGFRHGEAAEAEARERGAPAWALASVVVAVVSTVTLGWALAQLRSHPPTHRPQRSLHGLRGGRSGSLPGKRGRNRLGKNGLWIARDLPCACAPEARTRASPDPQRVASEPSSHSAGEPIPIPVPTRPRNLCVCSLEPKGKRRKPRKACGA